MVAKEPGCCMQVWERTEYGLPIIRRCSRKGKYARWGRRYCWQHVKKAQKPVRYRG